MENMQKNEVQIEGLTEKEAKEFKSLLSKFVKSYSAKDSKVSDKEWLKNELKSELDDLTDEQAETMAKETLDSVKEYDSNLKDLNEQCKKGIKREQWFADKLADAAVGVSITEYGNHLNRLDNVLENATQEMIDTVTKNNGTINLSKTLDGFIAEQHHVNTFNANAELNNSYYRAKILKPEGSGYTKNSVDIEIFDTRTGNIVSRYQSKYGKDSDVTNTLFKRGDYRGQQKLVPEGQGQDIPVKNTEFIEAPDGTKSNPLSKQEAENMRDMTQKSGEAPKMDWNTYSTKQLALKIGKQAGIAGLGAAAITAGFSLAEQVIRGDGIDTEETIVLALKTGADACIKAVVAGAIKAGAEKGILSFIPKGTPIGIIASITCVVIENIKILAKIAMGDYTVSQGLEHMGRTTVAMVLGLIFAAQGAAIGTAALSWIPVVGPILGGLAGGMIGYMAGSELGNIIYDGIKAIIASAIKTLQSFKEKATSFKHQESETVFG